MKRVSKCITQNVNQFTAKTIKPEIQRLDASVNFFFNCVRNYRRPGLVKVYSWQDTQRKCTPKFHEFPRDPPALSTSAKLCWVVMFIVKSALAAALVCWTCTEGFWGDSTGTEDLYYRMTSVILPDRPTRLPHLEGIKSTACVAYNRVVLKGMDVIVGVSREAHRRLRGLLFPCGTTEETGRKADGTI
ncbi:hypothetical protein PUN28_002932 [Cardiocondyla obscurior]|uniref:MICOS complex subunit MIC13 n=1 Tax=Cardiocondyla obscurior TaxID=286306 RepID=A0AAW2GWR8_9HYME